MNSSLERRLTAVIEDEVGALPQPPPDLFEAITRGAARRRRRNRFLTTGALCALVLALAGTLALVPMLRSAPKIPVGPEPFPSVTATPTRAPTVAPPTGPDRLPDFGAAKPIAEVWPQALVRLPMTVDGVFMMPYAILPGDRFLVQTGNTHNGPFAVYDKATGRATPITAPGETTEVDFAGIAGDRVVWTADLLGNASPEIRSARLDGGGSTLLARPEVPDGARVNIVSVTRDAVIWSLIRNETDRKKQDGSPAQPFPTEGRFVGLFRVPAAGGPIERIAGGDGFTASWHLPGIANTVHTWDTGQALGQVWDLNTGERSGYTRNPGMELMVCVGIEWCGGRSVAKHPAVQRLDGGGFVELPGEGSVAPLTGARFARITFDTRHPIVPNALMTTGAVLWDLKTGRVADLGDQGFGGHDGITSYTPGGSFMKWETDNGYILLDVSRIE
jgi:hypothetical protein